MKNELKKLESALLDAIDEFPSLTLKADADIRKMFSELKIDALDFQATYFASALTN